MPWKQIRPHAPDGILPPKGLELRFDFASPHSENLELRISVHYELTMDCHVMENGFRSRIDRRRKFGWMRIKAICLPQSNIPLKSTR